MPIGTPRWAFGSPEATFVCRVERAYLVAWSGSHLSLTGAEVKTLILDTAKRFNTTSVYKPGTRTRVSFGTLSRTGGVVDAQAALVKLYQH